MAVCRKEACARRSGGLAEHDRDLITACWPAVLKAASAAFASGVSIETKTWRDLALC